MTTDTGWQDLDDLPAPARQVITECVAEAWRATENGTTNGEDVAADVAQWLHRVYGVVIVTEDDES